jgi:hypothetical protein
MAIIEAIIVMLKDHPHKREFTASEVAAAVNHRAPRDCWTEKQRAELTTWIQRAGRHEFASFLPPRTLPSGVVTYRQGVFVVEIRAQ